MDGFGGEGKLGLEEQRRGPRDRDDGGRSESYHVLEEEGGKLRLDELLKGSLHPNNDLYKPIRKKIFM
jgi:hypothetical protein